jgi:hypothetical protein
MLAFRGPCPQGLEVRHGNSNGKDNRLSNLSYGTKSENAEDSLRTFGKRRVSIPPEMFSLIRSRYCAGDSVQKIADDLMLNYRSVVFAMRSAKCLRPEDVKLAG